MGSGVAGWGLTLAPKLVGRVETIRLDAVRPNGWNPNRVPDHIMESIRHGFRVDGWIVSQALLVWGSDDVGVPRGVIIDGEHRWTAARDVGLVEGPAVVLHGLAEREAKGLTVKLNQKRGDWDAEGLRALLADVLSGSSMSVGGASLDLGFSVAELEADAGAAFDALRGVPPPAPALPRDASGVTGAQPHLRVPLAFDVAADVGERLSRVFQHPTRPTELNADLLVRVAAFVEPPDA